MTKYELIPKEALDKALEILHRIKENVKNEKNIEHKFTILSDIDRVYNGIQQERCECNVMPYQEF